MFSTKENLHFVPTSEPQKFKIFYRGPLGRIYLGELDKQGEGTVTLRRREDQLLRYSDSWGINGVLVDEIRARWLVLRCEDGSVYVTSIPFLRANGTRFSHSRFEQQYFLPRRLWHINIARNFDQNPPKSNPRNDGETDYAQTA